MLLLLTKARMIKLGNISYFFGLMSFRMDIIKIFEIIFSIFFAIDYLWGFFNAKNKKNFIFDAFNFIDFLTILPVFFIPYEVQ